MEKEKKYDKLEEFLKKTPADFQSVSLGFSQIEQIISDDLPESSFTDRAWWANSTDGGIRSQAMAWINSKFSVSVVKFTEKYVIFKRN